MANYGDLLFPLITASELFRRLRTAEFVPFGPVGCSEERGGAFALGVWNGGRADEVRAAADLVLIGGGEIISGDRAGLGSFYGLHMVDVEAVAIDRWFVDPFDSTAPDAAPVVWHAIGVPELDEAIAKRVRISMSAAALIAVRDPASANRLRDAGVEREIVVVPDLAWLMLRLWPPDEMERRRARLIASGRLPPGPYVVVQGNGTMAPIAVDLVECLRRAFGEVAIVSVEVSPCHDDASYATLVTEAAQPNGWSFDAESAEDIMTVIAGAASYVGVSLHGAITAAVHDRPLVLLDPAGHNKLRAFADQIAPDNLIGSTPSDAIDLLVAQLHRVPDSGRIDRSGIVEAACARLDAYFDQLAELAVARPDRRELAIVDRPEWVHAGLARPPRPVGWAAPDLVVSGMRRPGPPDVDTLAAVWSRSRESIGVRWARARGEELELARLTGEASELRAAVERLLATLDQTERIAAAQLAELRGQCLHYEGLVAARDAEIAHLSSARGAIAQSVRRLLGVGRSGRDS